MNPENCPHCGENAVEQVSSLVWVCQTCGADFDYTDENPAEQRDYESEMYLGFDSE